MNNEEIMNLISQLYFSIYDNNLELTKTIVNTLNENCAFEKNNINHNLINEYNPFDNLTFLINNDSYEYALNNLNCIDNIDIYKWNYTMRKLLSNRNVQEIENIIEDFLNNKNTFLQKLIHILGEQKILLDLIRLSFIIQNFSLLEKLRKRIDKIERSE